MVRRSHGCATRRRGVVTFGVVITMFGLSVCTSNADASSGTASVQRTRKDTPAREPAWARRVPAVAEPQAPLEARARALDLAGGFRLSPPTADSTAARTAPSATGAATPGNYAGTMSIEVAYYDYCQTADGNLGFARSAKYQMAAQVFVNRRAENAGVVERSPFNLIVGTQVGVEASILLMSAQVVTDTRDGRSALIDYWDIDQHGDQITGALTDHWPGLSYNSIDTQQLLVPCQPNLGALTLSDPIAEGAQLAGTVTKDRITLQLVGQSLDREERFRATIAVRRTK
jgi:hypothetical protein